MVVCMSVSGFCTLTAALILQQFIVSIRLRSAVNFCCKNKKKRRHINNCMNVYHTAELNELSCISTNDMRRERNFTRFHWMAILVTETSFSGLAGNSVSRLKTFSELFFATSFIPISVKYGKRYRDV